MTANARRRTVWILTICVLGWVAGYFFCTSINVLTCDGFKSIKDMHEEVRGMHQNVSKATKSKEFSQHKTMKLLQKPGTVYDCLTWEVRSTYNTDLVKKEYTILPEEVDGAEGDGQRQKAFVEIYNKQLWYESKDRRIDASSKSYKASGPGASLEAAQGVSAVLHVMIDKLKQHLNKTKIKILDLPCGDLQWMSHFLTTRSDIDYTGMDIVPDLIDKHKKTYTERSNIRFQHFDIVKSKLDSAYDFIICRMMLQHLLNMDVLKALYHFSSSNSLYFGATSFPGTERNEELVPIGGRLRFLNLEKPPINLSPPLCTYQEPFFPDHSFAIWELPLLQHK